MVKHLRIFAKYTKLFVLAVLLVLIWGAVWLQASVHTLNFARGWILDGINSEDAPYSVSFDNVAIDWRNITELGKLRISHVIFTKRDGNLFAQLPEVYATVDPLGFLPHHRTLDKIILRGPHVFLNRSAQGEYQLGLEGGESSMPVRDLTASFEGDTPEQVAKPVRLPFRDFVIEHGSVTFHDEETGTDIASQDFTLALSRHSGRYGASLTLPFSYTDHTGLISAVLRANPGRHDYTLHTGAHGVPSELVCMFAPCPNEVHAQGDLDADMRLILTENGTLTLASARVATENLEITAPAWFEKPLKLGQSSTTVAYDVAAQSVTVSDTMLALEDTMATIDGVATKSAAGWQVDATGETGAMEVGKLRKYWPIALAPDSRAWVTSKLKAGHAEKAIAHLHLTPADFAAGELPDGGLDADVDARDVTVDYLPGFPSMEHVDGAVHFTGNSVKVDGIKGTLLDGTHVSKVTLWCPELGNFKLPMQIDLVATMPMTDVATILAGPTLKFDDAAGLDAKKISGEAVVAMKLKFNAFSGRKEVDPNAIHLEAVDYDINANLKNVAQPDMFGGYDVRGLSGELAASVKSLSFAGALTLADTGVTDIKLTRHEGGPLALDVKSRISQAQGAAVNDFHLTYQQTGEVPTLSIGGKRLDASVSYGKSEHSLLSDFPAIHLTLDLGEFLLASGLPFTEVKGTLDCTVQRCESAHLNALRGKGKVAAEISRVQGKRQFVLTASDAGEFLKALDITDRMARGKLELRGAYDDSKTPAPFSSHLSIQDFTLINSQILGRIFSIGSLTGLGNALTGSGISFDKMTATIAERAGIVTVSEGRANGNALGITVSGTVDTSNTKLDLKGVVVPAYAINSILGKIPLIGAIAGGEGEGIIAFNYAVKGTYRQPDVSVNAFSGLTPGFLRGIFGMFDAPTKPAGDKP